MRVQKRISKRGLKDLIQTLASSTAEHIRNLKKRIESPGLFSAILQQDVDVNLKKRIERIPASQ